jgi:hypothetical protein
MEAGQGPNWGCSAKEKKHIHPAVFISVSGPCLTHRVFWREQTDINTRTVHELIDRPG